jgi:hypothetical protein
MLSKHALEEYKEIHRQETGTVLPDDVLADEAINLLTLFSFVYRPIKKAWLQEYGRNHTRSGMDTPQQKGRNSSPLSSEENTGTSRNDRSVQA